MARTVPHLKRGVASDPASGLHGVFFWSCSSDLVLPQVSKRAVSSHQFHWAGAPTSSNPHLQDSPGHFLKHQCCEERE